MQVDLCIPQSLNADAVVRAVDRTYRSTDYRITAYDRGYSLITDASYSRVFAYIPPRQTQAKADFVADFEEGDEVEVIPAIEGTLVGIFWNPDIERWEVCTRNGVGGEYAFARPTEKGETAITFREMVLESLRIQMAVGGQARAEDIVDLDDAFILEALSRKCCYTCILQHPENHLVYPSIPFVSFLKLVGIYEIVQPEEGESAGKAIINEVPKESVRWNFAYTVFDREYDDEITLTSAVELEEFQQERFQEFAQAKNAGLDICSSDLSDTESVYHPPAWILTNQRTGHTCEIVNPFYEAAKEKRNMQPNMRFLYLDLLKKGEVESYLAAFSCYKRLFSEFAEEYAAFVQSIYEVYVNYYILKQRGIEYPKKFFVHAARLHHNVYLPSIGLHERKKITIPVVKTYLSELSATKLFHCLTLDA